MSGLPFLFPNSGDEWTTWLQDKLLPAVIALAVIVVLQWALRYAITRWLRKLVRRGAQARGEDERLARQRSETFVAVVNWVIAIIAFFAGLVVVLSALGADLTAIFASAGILGLAVSLGAQQLVRDLINGTFILAENQYQVGDTIQVANTTGTVVELTPRRTVLRDGSGNVHYIPNGEIRVATNQTRDFSRINMEVSFAYGHNLDEVIAVVNDVGTQLAEERPDDFISAPKVVSVDKAATSRVVLKVTGDVKPFVKPQLTNELRKRVILRFEAEGIPLPAEDV
jgi:small conductance mechanosensitive channel